MEKFSKYLDLINQKHGIQKTFNDFLTISVCALSSQTQEDLYFKTIKAYNEKEIQLFGNAFASLVFEMDNNGEGLKDCLGGYFEEFCSSDKSGQFFTPEPICLLMAKIINPHAGNSVSDPTCGSGRLFLASAKENRFATFYGADICLQCCQMTLINMCLNGLLGYVYWQDSLANTLFDAWRISLHPINGVPFIELLPKIEEKKELIKADLSPQLDLFKESLSQYDLF